MPRPTVLVSTVLLCALGCGDEKVESESRSILDGIESASDESVVALSFRGGFYCSGVLIAPHVVLTAAHCTPSDDLQMHYTEVVFGERLSDAYAHIPVAAYDAWEWNPDAREGDLGLLALKFPVSVEPAELWLGHLSTGDEVRVVGFGSSEVGGDGSVNWRRQGQGVIADLTSTGAIVHSTRNNACPGDSGGPAFVDLGGGDERVALITSRSACQYDASSYHERITPYVDYFITPFIDAYEPSCRNDPGCSYTPPDLQVSKVDATEDTATGCTAGNQGASTAGLVLLLILVTMRRRDHPCAS